MLARSNIPRQLLHFAMTRGLPDTIDVLNYLTRDVAGNASAHDGLLSTLFARSLTKLASQAPEWRFEGSAKDAMA